MKPTSGVTRKDMRAGRLVERVAASASDVPPLEPQHHTSAGFQAAIQATADQIQARRRDQA